MLCAYDADMNNSEAGNTTDPLPLLSLEETLQQMQRTLRELFLGQQRIIADLNLLKSNQDAVKQEVRDRYVDLRERIDLNNDKLDVVQRELRQLIKDMRNPTYSN